MIEYRSVPLVKQVCDALEREINNAVRSQGLTYSQIQFLLRLFESEESALPLKDLEKRLKVSQSTIAGLAKRLEMKKFIEMLDDAGDKRIKHAKITQLGIKKCNEAHGHMEKIERKLGLTEIEALLFYELLSKVNRNLD